MKNIGLELKNTKHFVDTSRYITKAENSINKLFNSTGKGSDYLGWLNLPNDISENFFKEINETADLLKKQCEIVVIIGIGGSYLGAKAVIEALSNSFAQLIQKESPKVLFAGQNLGEDYLFELTELLKDKRFGIVCISKSGTTTEPAIAFRLLKAQLESQIGKHQAKDLIVCITDRDKGALRTLANKEGYKTFIIEDNVGGRFSVLTPVGLLPIAIAGFEIEKLIDGARDMRILSLPSKSFEKNIAMQYAATRIALYESGKKIEILASYNPKLQYIAEWWKQLYGESEGKEGKSLFPASVNLTSDLHSMGQWIQDGERTVFETVITIEDCDNTLTIPSDEFDLDGLNFLAGKRIDFVNKMAEKGTCLAHVDGGVPNIQIQLPKINEYYIGQLIYFFEVACGISAYILDVNPFDQPGVEEYKRNMFALLAKPGYEQAAKELHKRL